MYGDSDGSKDPGSAPPPSDQPFPNRELTLSSYLCDKPTLASAAAAEAAAAASAAAGTGPSSPPNPAADAAAAEAAKLCVKRDFLHLSAPKRGGDPTGPGVDSSVVGGKKPHLDSLQLSLSLASDEPAQPSSHPQQQLPSLLPSADGAVGCRSCGTAVCGCGRVSGQARLGGLRRMASGASGRWLHDVDGSLD